MEYTYRNSVDDFVINYSLVVPDDPLSSYQLSEAEQSFIRELDDAYGEIERLTCQADGYDYALSVSSGIIAGLIDSFFVGEWDFLNAKIISNTVVDNKILKFAEKDPRYTPWCKGIGKTAGWGQRDPNRLASAVEFLEEKYVLPGDNDWKFEGSGISASSHHLDDFCHHPTLVGMICCIIVQFTENATYHTFAGDVMTIPVSVNEYGNFVSDKVFGKIFAGIINWFIKAARTLRNWEGHLMSDMAGSISSVRKLKGGAGIPGTVMSTLKELSAFPCINESSFAENLRKAYQNGIGNGKRQINLGILNNLFDGASSKFDMRTELAVMHELKRQSVPVKINEIIVRSFYFVRRLVEQLNVKQSLMEIEWNKLLPMNNRTIVRMITISSGIFSLFDSVDAAIRSSVETRGNPLLFFEKYILRVNFVGIGRFAIAVGADLYMEVRRGRMEMAVACGEIAVVAIEEKKIIEETSDINKRTDEKMEKMKSVLDEMSKSIF